MAERWLTARGLSSRTSTHLVHGLTEFVAFGVKAAWACLFAALLLLGIVVTSLWWPDALPLARYDFLVFYAVAIQLAFLATRLERPREAIVILVFHLTGTAMEVFKTAQGSWTYPGEGVLFIGGVPLFSGFMYAAVGSYLARAWRTFEFRFDRHPPLWAVMTLAAAVYGNFFWHHHGPDLRWLLFAASILLFGPTMLRFRVLRFEVPMPLLLGFVLTSGFIYLAENIGTLSATWTYPDQIGLWRPVSLTKWGSWYLLMLLSYGLVAMLHGGGRTKQGAPAS
nr:DUF817 domain-containing protein [Parvularcula dongshanensis]